MSAETFLRRLLTDRARPSLDFAQYCVAVMRRLKEAPPRQCNICSYFGRFRSDGYPPRFEAACPHCGALEHHRLFKLWLDRRGAALKGADILHLAPDPHLGTLLEAMAGSYMSGDLEPGRADHVLNIEALALAEESFDCIVCSHLLEHVDDRKALAEMLRVLRPGGVALIMTPVVEGWAETYENGALTSPLERSAHFGEADHVRFYGADLRDRIRTAGFELDEFTAIEPFVSRHGLIRGEKVFIAGKPG